MKNGKWCNLYSALLHYFKAQVLHKSQSHSHIHTLMVTQQKFTRFLATLCICVDLLFDVIWKLYFCCWREEHPVLLDLHLWEDLILWGPKKPRFSPQCWNKIDGVTPFPAACFDLDQQVFLWRLRRHKREETQLKLWRQLCSLPSDCSF